MKVSEITVNDIVNYLRLDEGDYIPTEIEALINTAKLFISNYTGIPITSTEGEKVRPRDRRAYAR